MLADCTQSAVGFLARKIFGERIQVKPRVKRGDRQVGRTHPNGRQPLPLRVENGRKHNPFPPPHGGCVLGPGASHRRAPATQTSRHIPGGKITTSPEPQRAPPSLCGSGTSDLCLQEARWTQPPPCSLGLCFLMCKTDSLQCNSRKNHLTHSRL